MSKRRESASPAEVTFEGSAEGLVIVTPHSRLLVSGGPLEEMSARFDVAVTEARLDSNGMQECTRCGDEVITLSTDGLCDGCVEEDESTVECPNCGERVPEDEMNHWPELKKPISMCDSCEHNARRSGWEPGQ